MKRQIVFVLLSLLVLLLLVSCSPSDFPPEPGVLAPFEAVRNFISGAVVFVPNFADPSVTEEHLLIDPTEFVFSDVTQQLTVAVHDVHIVYRFGYVWYGGSWHKFEFDGKPVLAGSNWLYQEALADIDVTHDFEEGQHGVAAYACFKTPDGWNCNDNQWMVQIVKVKVGGGKNECPPVPISSIVCEEGETARDVDDDYGCYVRTECVPAECVDSDGADYFTKGVMQYKTSTDTIPNYDTCTDEKGGNPSVIGTHVNEYVCPSDIQKSDIIIYKCPNGCKEGACLREPPLICDQYTFSTCPKDACVQKCVPSGCTSDGICTTDCADVPGSCVAKRDARCEERAQKPAGDCLGIAYEFDPKTKTCVEATVTCGFTRPFTDKSECENACAQTTPACPATPTPLCVQGSLPREKKDEKGCPVFTCEAPPITERHVPLNEPFTLLTGEKVSIVGPNTQYTSPRLKFISTVVPSCQPDGQCPAPRAVIRLALRGAPLDEQEQAALQAKSSTSLISGAVVASQQTAIATRDVARVLSVNKASLDQKLRAPNVLQNKLRPSLTLREGEKNNLGGVYITLLSTELVSPGVYRSQFIVTMDQPSVDCNFFLTSENLKNKANACVNPTNNNLYVAVQSSGLTSHSWDGRCYKTENEARALLPASQQVPGGSSPPRVTVINLAQCKINECTDSDRGTDYYVKGTTSRGDTDLCLGEDLGAPVRDGPLLIEYSCSGYGKESYRCPGGCKNGACAKESSKTCDQYTSSTCPKDGCVQKCVPSSCTPGGICTADCADVPGSCVAKQDARCEERAQKPSGDCLGTSYEFNPKTDTCVEVTTTCGITRPFMDKYECETSCVQTRPIVCPSVDIPACRKDSSSADCAAALVKLDKQYPGCGFGRPVSVQAIPSELCGSLRNFYVDLKTKRRPSDSVTWSIAAQRCVDQGLGYAVFQEENVGDKKKLVWGKTTPAVITKEDPIKTTCQSVPPSSGEQYVDIQACLSQMPNICGNNICEQGEADNPGVCTKDVPAICSGGLPGTCPRDCVQLLPKPVERDMGLGAPQPGNCLVRASVSSNPDIRCSIFPPPGFEFNSVTKQCAQVSAGCGGSVPFSSKGQCISSCINQCPSKASYVCGVDAKTYHNDCVARSAGVSVLHTGQCVEKDRCALTASSSGLCTRIETVFEFVGNACVSKELKGCTIISPFKTKGQCDRVCVGATCPTNFDPVCAYGGPTNSNKKTYDNECLALSNGLTILNKGKCTQDVLAECNTQPEDTVCSATGKEYRNNCAATLAQVNVLQRGGCSPRQRERELEPLLDPPQNQKQVVDVELFSDDQPVIDTDSGLRLVRARLVDGSGHVMVVQDSSHVNRNNLVFRIVNTEQTGGIVKTNYIQHTIDTSTRIIPVTARIVGKTTLAEEAQGAGVPIKIDDGGLCATNFDPVCGSDGKTYPNECKALGAGVNVVAKGECVAVPGQCADSDGSNYFTKGNVVFQQKTYVDACLVFGLNEYVCKNDAVDSQVVLCQCKDGACLR